MRTQRSRAPVTRAFSPVFEISRGPPQPSPRCRLPATAAATAITKHTTCPPFLTPVFTPLPIDVRTFFFPPIFFRVPSRGHSTFLRSLIFQRQVSRSRRRSLCNYYFFFLSSAERFGRFDFYRSENFRRRHRCRHHLHLHRRDYHLHQSPRLS